MNLQLRFESLGVDVVQASEVGVSGAGDHDLDVAKPLACLRHERRHGVGFGDVERKRDRLATAGADLFGDLLALVNAPGAQRHREAVRGEVDRGRRPDAR